MKLSENLKNIRKENNLSQEQLAEKLGVSRQAVSKWESGQSYPEMDKVLLICKLFNYNMDELMNENIKEVEENKQSKNNINILNPLKRKTLLYEISKMNEYQIRDYNSASELTYFSDKHKQDQYKFFKLTKNIYMQADTPEEITTYYHNYRVIKTRIWQVKLALDIIKKLNKVLEGIFWEKDIIKYEGIALEELNEYLKELKKDEISMLDLSNKIMKVEKI